jgi:hypothetical protein
VRKFPQRVKILVLRTAQKQGKIYLKVLELPKQYVKKYVQMFLQVQKPVIRHVQKISQSKQNLFKVSVQKCVQRFRIFGTPTPT